MVVVVMVLLQMGFGLGCWFYGLGWVLFMC